MKKFFVDFTMKDSEIPTIRIIVYANTPRVAYLFALKRLREDYPTGEISHHLLKEVLE